MLYDTNVKRVSAVGLGENSTCGGGKPGVPGRPVSL